MSDFAQLRSRLGAARDAVAAQRSQLAALDAKITDAGRAGDEAAIATATRQRAAAAAELTKARVTLATASEGFTSGVRDSGLFDGVDTAVGVVGDAGAQLPGVDEAVPIVLLPVRLETRLRGGHLLIRIYPDDVHVDDHEPQLDAREYAAGQAYWSTLATPGDGAADGAWNTLSSTVGVYRALWVRQQTRPGTDGATPELTLRQTGTARAATARALPDVFVARVRTTTGQPIFAQGSPVLDELDVGIEWGGDPAGLLDDNGVMVGGMAWLSDFAAAVNAGMALDVDLHGATAISDVTVVGVTVSLDSADSAAMLAELIGDHRVSSGAGIVAPGTPTNNLSDSPSGVDFRPSPATLDPNSAPDPDADSDAAVLSAALGLPLDALVGLPGADARAVAGQGTMQRALFEASWGPFLRQQGVPAFTPAQLPAVYRHVTEYVRPGGPLPVLRLGKQPYGILPVQPPGAQAAEDEPFVRWLTGFLPGLRQLWIAGTAESANGLDILGFEPASSRVRIRSAIGHYTYSALEATGIVLSGGVAGIGGATLAAELGLGATIPMVARNFFADASAPLRLPMSVDGETSFDIRNPAPEDATSILGLLLRNAAVQVVDAAADEQLIASHLFDEVALARPMTATFTELADVAVSTNDEVSTAAPMTTAQKLAETVTVAGTTGTVGDWVNGLISGAGRGVQIDAGSHLASDAVRAFAVALDELAALPIEQRALIAGQVIDSTSHRYDAWVTSLAVRRLAQLRTTTPAGIQFGAWGHVGGFAAQELDEVPDKPGVYSDRRNRGWVLAPSIRHAATAGVLRATWHEHGGGSGAAPFAVDLHSDRVRLALGLAQGMREGQQLGALLGYRIERSLHEAFTTRKVEADWLIYQLRSLYPLRIRTLEDTGADLADERLVVNGWTLVDEELATSGAVAAKMAPAIADAYAGEAAEDRPALVAGANAALADAVAEAIGALDAFADLNLGEALYQLDGSNFERAAAATDAIGRAAPPPDSYDVVTTPRAGTAIEQRLLLVLGNDTRPPGYTDTSPRALIAPRTDAFLADRLGSLAGIDVRVTDAYGRAVATVPLASLDLSALDLAADAARTDAAGLFPLLTALAIAASAPATPATGIAAATGIGLDADTDAALLTLLRRAAAWHRALVGRRPLSATSFGLQSSATTPSVPEGLATAVAAARTALTPGNARLFGILTSGTQADQDVARRAAAADSAADPVAAATALFGDEPVLEGSCEVPDSIRVSAADQAAIGVSAASLGAWLQDSARVRDAARALDEAALLDELASGSVLPSLAAQDPVLPYREATPATRTWVGGALPLPLSTTPVTSVVAVGTGTLDGTVTGIELDAWSEVVPDRVASGAVTANLAAPNSRAPNTILLGVPGPGVWTRSALFGVVDEALTLAQCRLVDLDAVKRIPRLLPAIYLSDYDVDDGKPWRDFVAASAVDPARWRWAGGVS
jgi:hypothetical protein